MRGSWGWEGVRLEDQKINFFADKNNSDNLRSWVCLPVPSCLFTANFA